MEERIEKIVGDIIRHAQLEPVIGELDVIFDARILALALKANVTPKSYLQLSCQKYAAHFGVPYKDDGQKIMYGLMARYIKDQAYRVYYEPPPSAPEVLVAVQLITKALICVNEKNRRNESLEAVHIYLNTYHGYGWDLNDAQQVLTELLLVLPHI